MRDTDRRAALVFVPGFMQRGDAWAAVAERLSERYPSVLLDHSSWTYEERLAEIAAASPPAAVVVGYSMGGRLALHAALRHPGRFAGLVLVGASAGIDDESERRARRQADESLARWIERRPIEEVVSRWEALPVFASQPPALVAAQRPGRLSHDPARLAALLRSAGQGALEPLWERLGNLDLPLLALAGEQDERYLEAARRMAGIAPHAESRAVPGAGHAPQLEAPGAVAALLGEFLDERVGEGGVLHRDA